MDRPVTPPALIERLKTRSSAENLLALFRMAESRKTRIRCLHIGTPREFRMHVISQFDETNTQRNEVCRLLVSPDIENIEFLVADPFGEPLLRRLDREGRSAWDIRRIQIQILEFVEGLLRLSEQRSRSGSLHVGIHRSALIWNLDIVGDDIVQFRAYGRGTGHDGDVEDLRAQVGTPDQFGEAFINEFESIRTRRTTRWFSSVNKFQAYRNHSSWPDLYKGNAVIPCGPVASDFEDTDEAMFVFYKICLQKKSHKAELHWLDISTTERRECSFFRPATLIHPKEFEWRGEALGITPSEGSASLFDVAAELQLLGAESAEMQERAGFALGLLVGHSIEALHEFRETHERIRQGCPLEVYPYSKKLVAALEAVLPYQNAVPQEEISRALEDAAALGKELEGHSTVPFRDAHLKNRLFDCARDATDLAQTMLGMDPEKLPRAIRDRILDVDFETAFHLVTEWDDVAHVLLFEHCGFSPVNQKPGRNIFGGIRKWWGMDVDEDLFRKTVLARAIREHCRRVWYARTMPDAYLRRYGRESRDYFLKLALWASTRLGGLNRLRTLLRACFQGADLLWDRVPNKELFETVEAKFQPKLKQLFHGPGKDDRQNVGGDLSRPASGGRGRIQVFLEIDRANLRAQSANVRAFFSLSVASGS